MDDHRDSWGESSYDSTVSLGQADELRVLSKLEGVLTLTKRYICIC